MHSGKPVAETAPVRVLEEGQEDFGDRIRDVLTHSRIPVLMLQLPTQIVTSASPGAQELFEPVASPVTGRSLLDLTEPHSSGGMHLLLSSRISGYEATHVLRKTGDRCRFWVSALPGATPPRAALAVLAKDEPPMSFVPVTWQGHESLRPVMGTTDARLMIDRVTPEVHASLGFPADEVIGRSLLELISAEDVPAILSALAEAAGRRETVSRSIGAVDADGEVVRCRLVLLPLLPEPSCAFALLADGGGGEGVDSRTVAELITRLGRGVRGAMAAPSAPAGMLRPDLDLGHLSDRELEVISHLIAGDRVPAIARRLYLSEGTIRNNLSSAFAKVGVKNQQQLIDLLRASPSQPRA